MQTTSCNVTQTYGPAGQRRKSTVPPRMSCAGLTIALRQSRSPSSMPLASSGLLKVITDPRTTMPQSLQALLVAELADNEGWSTLIKLAEGFDQHQMAADFRTALEAEERHLTQVRSWLSAHIQEEAGAA